MNIDPTIQTEQLLVCGSGLSQKYIIEYPGLNLYRSILSKINDILIEYCTETSKLILTRNNILIKEIQMYIWLPEPTNPDYWFRYRILEPIELKNRGYTSYANKLIEDVNKYISDFMPNDLTGAICTNRHIGVDIILHYQTIGRIKSKVLQNVNIIRLHNFKDTVKKHKNKF
jgi:hypothetical protein